MIKNVFQQMYKYSNKNILRDLRETKKIIDFIETYKINCKGDPEFDGLDKSDIKEIFGFMWKDRLIDEKEKFIKLGLDYINQPITFSNQKELKKFLDNTNYILKQNKFLTNQSEWNMKTGISFKSEKLWDGKHLSNCKDEINSFDLQNQQLPNKYKNNALKI
ncbi:hypothetical protein [Spiroplasma endosymbiont of Aleiodes alternator]|uniref:hypothetical protein n=1 Tax=Spiroplasma endosymbiont of Aleiodes alternator TaxID=3139329 RepID=UPI003CCADC56